MIDEKIIINLTNKDPNVRIETIISLKKLGLEKATEILILTLSNDNQDLQNTIMSTLLEIGKPTIPYLMNALKSTNDTIRNKATKILTEVADISLSNEILNLLKEGNGYTKAAAIDVLGGLKDVWSAEYIREFLSHLDSQVRIAATRALGNLKDKLSIDLILTLLDDNDDKIKIAAAEALGKINNPIACNGLWQLNNTSKNPEVRNTALFALKQIGESAIKPYVKNFLSDDVELRTKTEYELGSLGKAVLLPLLEYSRHYTISVRKLCARIFGNIGDEIATRRLVEMTNDVEAEVRVTAVMALGHIKTEASLKHLITCLQNPDPLVVDAASAALTSRGMEIVNLLTDLLADRDLNLQITIARLIGKIGDSEFVPMLAKHLNDPRMWVRRAVCFALGETKNPIAANLLIEKGLSDYETLVRAAAAKALGKFKMNIVSEALIKSLHDSEESVQLTVIGAIKEQGLTEAGPNLLRFLSYDSIMLKISAIRTLAQIKYIESIPMLKKLSKRWPFSSETNEVRAEARVALKKLIYESQFVEK